jgi:hypothetical protein
VTLVILSPAPAGQAGHCRVLLRDLLKADAGLVRAPQEVKVRAEVFHGAVELDRDGDEAEAEGALPYRACHARGRCTVDAGPAFRIEN